MLFESLRADTSRQLAARLANGDSSGPFDPIDEGGVEYLTMGGLTPLGTSALLSSQPSIVVPLARSDELTDHLCRLVQDDPERWSREGEYAPPATYYQYPALMAARIQRDVIESICSVDSEVRVLLDPFAGAGTILAEGMLAGLDIDVQDINPLAVLLCRTKSGPFAFEPVFCAVGRTLALVRADTGRNVAVDFPGREKWFTISAAIALSKIKRAIESNADGNHRRFLWAALAETVRLTSNSRTSTYKLHARPAESLVRLPDPTRVFEEICSRNLDRFVEFSGHLRRRGRLRESGYIGRVSISLSDSRLPSQASVDLIVTSPPYGDNKTTVPYGQSSFLPLQWIALSDVDERADRTHLVSTSEIDSRSLGGRLGSVTTARAITELVPSSSSFQAYLEGVEDQLPDRRDRVAGFVYDLSLALTAMSERLRPGGYAVFTLGDRSVGGQRVPLSSIVSELLATRGFEPVVMLNRSIGSKRMATKNNVSATMSTERVLVLRKGQ